MKKERKAVVNRRKSATRDVRRGTKREQPMKEEGDRRRVERTESKGSETFDYDTYLSPFTWRYGSDQMRRLFSERGRRAVWRSVWSELARAEANFGLVSREELHGIEAAASLENVDIGAAHELEKKIRHDLMAELRVFANQAGPGGGKLHLGATSMDIEDNADVVTYREAVAIIVERLVNCLEALRGMILRYKGMVCMAWTHLQPAEPTTLGYRFASYAQDLVSDLRLVEFLRDNSLRGKGMKGAVGTSASFKKLLGSKSPSNSPRTLEDEVMTALGLEAYPIATQTYPRKADYLLLAALASIAASCHKFALDLRVLQSPTFGELSEPIEEFQVGSSAMPFKRNPVTAERICSLARLVAAYPCVANANAANSILERTLDDSANRRVIIPEAFLGIDECLMAYERLAGGLKVYPAMIDKNLAKFGPFAGTEAVMMRLVELGGDRQALHEMLRVQSFIAWDEVMKGNRNPIVDRLAENSAISSKLSRQEIEDLIDPRHHTGDAEERCDAFVKDVIDPIIKSHREVKNRKVLTSKVVY